MALCCSMDCPGCLIWHLIQMLICSSWEVTLKRFFHWLRIIGQMGSPLEHGCLCVWDSRDMTSAGNNNNIPHRGNPRLSWTELSMWFFLTQALFKSVGVISANQWGMSQQQQVLRINYRLCINNRDAIIKYNLWQWIRHLS